MIVDIISYIFLAIGCIFCLLGAIGVHRFPDPYTRLHATGMISTFGAIFVIGSVIIQAIQGWVTEGLGSPQQILAIHSLVALASILLTSPTSTHAIARASHRSGIKAARAVVDDLKEPEEKKE